MKWIARGPGLVVAVLLAGPLGAADWEVEVRGPAEPGGHLRVVLHDDPLIYSRGGRPRHVRSVRWEGDRGSVRFEDLEPGEFAVVAFLDRDDDGRFDPPSGPPGRGGPGSGELAAYSRNPLLRSPRPPEWDRIRVRVGEEDRRDTLQLGVRPSPWSIGLGTVISTQPYDGIDDRVIPIPAISYRGERLRIEGPSLDYGVVIAPPVRVGVVIGYRFDGYDPDDSDALTGMDEREDTLELGARGRIQFPGRLRLDLRATHDVLGRHQGGEIRATVARRFVFGDTALEPFLSANWLSREFADYYFGVDTSEAIPGRPRTKIGSVVHPQVGVNASLWFGERWLALARTSVEFLSDEVRDSPIVDEDVRLRLLLAVSYTF